MGLRHLLEGLDRDLTLVIRESAARDRTSVLVKSDYEALLNRLRGLLERLDGLSVAQVERLVEDPDLVQLAFHAGEEAAAIRKGATARDRLAPSLRFMARHQRP